MDVEYIARDFLGRDIQVGDKVVFVQLQYRNLMVGTITKITPKMCIIEHKETNVCSTTTKQFHDQVIKIVGEYEEQ